MRIAYLTLLLARGTILARVAALHLGVRRQMGQPLGFVNVESLVTAFLQGRTELGGVPVAARLPSDYDGASAIVVVSRVGGEFSAEDWLDRALIRIDAYGPGRTAALNLAGTVRGLIWLMPDVSPIGDVAVADIVEQRGPSQVPDPAFPTANRYVARYHVLVRVGPGLA